MPEHEESSSSNVEVFIDNEGSNDQLSCSSYSLDEDGNSGDHVLQEGQPYQFEPELTDREVEEREATAASHAWQFYTSDRQLDTNWK